MPHPFRSITGFFLGRTATEDNHSVILQRSGILWKFFLLSYVLLLVNAAPYLEDIAFVSVGTVVFSILVYLTYCFIYLFPIFFVLLGLNRLLAWHWLQRAVPALKAAAPWILYSVAVATFSAVQLFIFIDNRIYEMFGFHFNGFVWNLVFTKGGIESMGGGTSAYLSAVGLIALVIGLQTGLLVLVLKAHRVRAVLGRMLPRRVVLVLFGLLLLGGGMERVTYGVSNIYSYKPILFASRVFPFYVPCTFELPTWLVGDRKSREFHLKPAESITALRYPLRPIRQKSDAPRYNIVWLVAESLRADMVDPEIMPVTWKFAQKSAWFRHHYSGGNGTRMGIFAMFYGLYGNYWFPFLDGARSPALVDLLLKNNYQTFLYTSAKFTYPEFNKTIWARIQPELLHEGDSGLEGWKNDRKNVTDMLRDIENRDPSHPFLAFMFFESPHARYYFPPECVIRPDYLDDFNYVTVDLEKDIGRIWNRYVNSCNHLDTQYARVIEYLEANNLLDSTIVIVTGDHGEEFMEKGRWGHNSAFTEEQTLTPLVIWAPGREPLVTDRMTSHLDVPATVMNLLGVVNPPEDYSLGYDLLGPVERQYTVLSDWNDMAIVVPEFKAEFTLQSLGIGGPDVTTKTDAPIDNAESLLESRRPQLVAVMKDMTKFGK